MKLSILGCYSATPRALTNPTSQVLDIRGHLFLIDCGEGTQVQLRKQKIKFARIKHIFISHLHGDHFFGLPGLISTFMLLGREAELHVYGPKGIKKAVTAMLTVGNTWTNFPLIFHELTSQESEVVFEDDKVVVRTVPLVHRVYTNGFFFKERPLERKLDIEAVEAYDIDVAYYRKIKQGQDVENKHGVIVSNDQITLSPPPSKSYAFCSDTAYTEKILSIIKDVTVLYHESTFTEAHKHLTAPTGHSTAAEAAMIAKKANARMLILGHYSTRYKGLEVFKEEAETVFSNVHLAEDGKEFQL
ncbi:ribonuclease Z [Zhouia spongiae]|uniref:Ribonuclease Z n=1 Tax=Zhouia spongiae TaxID=2202721 RepID=A0ABY3YM43_9FLAO|nr:ribonuclease Z [Zhouia spongiae]UNY98664.1 ribonuclease Z [Zhouia spongiae]